MVPSTSATLMFVSGQELVSAGGFSMSVMKDEDEKTRGCPSGGYFDYLARCSGVSTALASGGAVAGMCPGQDRSADSNYKAQLDEHGE